MDGFELHGALVVLEPSVRDVEDPGVHQGRGVPLRPRDRVREGDRPPQLARGFLGFVRLGESVDREGHAEHASHHVELRRVLPAAGLVQLLDVFAEGLRDRVRRDAQDDHAAVGQQVLPHGIAEAQPVELRSVDPGVGHVDNVDAPGLECLPGALGVDSRRGRHVEALRGVQPRVVVNSWKSTLKPFRELLSMPVVRWASSATARSNAGASCPCLRLGDPAEGVVRDEHGGRVAGVREEFGDPRRVGGDRASSSERRMSSRRPPGDGSEQTTSESRGRVVWRSHSRRAWETSAMVGAAKSIRPPSATVVSAIRRAAPSFRCRTP